MVDLIIEKSFADLEMMLAYVRAFEILAHH